MKPFYTNSNERHQHLNDLINVPCMSQRNGKLHTCYGIGRLRLSKAHHSALQFNSSEQGCLADWEYGVVDENPIPFDALTMVLTGGNRH